MVPGPGQSSEGGAEDGASWPSCLKEGASEERASAAALPGGPAARPGLGALDLGALDLGALLLEGGDGGVMAWVRQGQEGGWDMEDGRSGVLPFPGEQGTVPTLGLPGSQGVQPPS